MTSEVLSLFCIEEEERKPQLKRSEEGFRINTRSKYLLMNKTRSHESGKSHQSLLQLLSMTLKCHKEMIIHQKKF
jgi:hypothetical protein